MKGWIVWDLRKYCTEDFEIDDSDSDVGDRTSFAGEGDIIAHDFHTWIELGSCPVDFTYQVWLKEYLLNLHGGEVELYRYMPTRQNCCIQMYQVSVCYTGGYMGF